MLIFDAYYVEAVGLEVLEEFTASDSFERNGHFVLVFSDGVHLPADYTYLERMEDFARFAAGASSTVG